MSEDSVKVDFSMSEKTFDKNNISDLVSRYAEAYECEDIDIQYKNNNVTVSFLFCMFFEDTIKSLLIDLNDIQAKDSIVSCWYDTSGEEAYYVLSDNKLLAFNNKNELSEYKQKKMTTYLTSESRVTIIQLSSD